MKQRSRDGAGRGNLGNIAHRGREIAAACLAVVAPSTGLYATDLELNGDQLIVHGTDSWTTPDKIEIVIDGTDLVVKRIGLPVSTGTYLPMADVATIVVWLDDGNDTFQAPDIAIPMTVNCGEGDDVVWTGSADDHVFGEWGNDIIRTGAGDDVLHGFVNVAYSDIMDPYDDQDFLHGGPGLDTISGGPDADVLHAGDGGPGVGFEYLYGFYADTPDTYDLPFDGDDQLFGSDNKNMIWGGPGDDTIEGGSNSDWLYGQEGDDTISGFQLADQIWGHAGVDTISAGRGADIVDAGADDDIVDGGAGDDTLDGGVGNDTIDGGPDNDTIDGGPNADLIDGGEGEDTIDGGSGVDFIYGGDGDDTIDGGSDGDFIYGEAGDDVIDCGAGDDHVWSHGGDDVVWGGAGADVIALAHGNDFADGGEGVDEITGGPGHDTLIGGIMGEGSTDSDLLFGEGGDDLLYGGPGQDELDGGGGNDLLVAIDGANDDVLVGGGGFDSFWSDDLSTLLTSNREVASDLSTAEEETNAHYVPSFVNGADFTWDGDAIDDPDATGVDAFVRYDDYSHLPLFPAGGPAMVDISQGLQGDCWLVAALGATANVSQNALRQTVIPLPDGTFIVELGSSFLAGLFGDPTVHYRVDADLPVGEDDDGNEFLCFAGAGTVYSTEASVWVAVIEKAVALDRLGLTAIWRADTYDDTTFGMAGAAFRDIGAEGRTVGESLADLLLGGGVVQSISDALDEGRAVAVCSGPDPVGLPVEWHWYVALEVTFDAAGEPDTVLIFNPHGVDDADGVITWGDPSDGIIEVAADDLADSLAGTELVGLSIADFDVFDE